MLRPAPSRGYKKVWLCRCSCGREVEVQQSNLLDGHSTRCRSCSITRIKTTHGMVRTPEYRSWCSILERCLNPNTAGFERWGGRGIKVCKRWRSSFEAFYADMGPRPSPKHSIDRVNNDGHYTPKNSRWATAKTQTRNMRTSLIVTYMGRRQSLAAWCEELGLRYATVWARLRVRKWGAAKSFEGAA